MPSRFEKNAVTQRIKLHGVSVLEIYAEFAVHFDPPPDDATPSDVERRMREQYEARIGGLPEQFESIVARRLPHMEAQDFFRKTVEAAAVICDEQFPSAKVYAAHLAVLAAAQKVKGAYDREVIARAVTVYQRALRDSIPASTTS